MMNKIRVSALALGIALAAAPQLFAEARPEVLVCRDGHVTSTRFGDEACRRHRGIDREATMRARRNGVVYSPNGVYAPNTNRGVYGGSVYGPATTNRGVYRGATTTTNRPVYGSTTPQRGVYGGAVPNGTNRSVYGTVNPNNNGTYHRDHDDHDDDDDHAGPGRNGRGHAYGHYKQKHEDKKHGGDRDR